MSDRFTSFKDRDVWLDHLYAVPGGDLSFAAKAVGLRLARHHNIETGQCNPSLAKLAAGTGMSERSVRRMLRELEEAGWLRTDHSQGRHSNSFELLSPTRTHMAGLNPDTAVRVDIPNPVKTVRVRETQPGQGCPGNPDKPGIPTRTLLADRSANRTANRTAKKPAAFSGPACALTDSVLGVDSEGHRESKKEAPADDPEPSAASLDASRSQQSDEIEAHPQRRQEPIDDDGDDLDIGDIDEDIDDELARSGFTICDDGTFEWAEADAEWDDILSDGVGATRENAEVVDEGLPF